ncbi:hypothetical protein ABK040_011432 [Willaertia magna]
MLAFHTLVLSIFFLFLFLSFSSSFHTQQSQNQNQQNYIIEQQFNSINSLQQNDYFNNNSLPLENCNSLDPIYLNCSINSNCKLNTLQQNTFCKVVNSSIPCHRNREFYTNNLTTNSFLTFCNYCYQLKENIHYKCDYSFTKCQSGQDNIIVNCKVKRHVICLGQRNFRKISVCNFNTGKNWSSAFSFSLFLSGLAADRWYLGHLGWGFFKFFTFGGIGIWAIIDTILISVGYLSPGDGSVWNS